MACTHSLGLIYSMRLNEAAWAAHSRSQTLTDATLEEFTQYLPSNTLKLTEV